MKLTKEQREKFDKSVQPLMEFLGTLHPHVSASVTVDVAELKEGVSCYKTKKFIKD